MYPKFPIIFEHCSSGESISCYREPKYDRLTPFYGNLVYYLLALTYSRVVYNRSFFVRLQSAPQEKMETQQ